LRVAGEFVGEELQRDESEKFRVLSLIDNAHAPAAQLLDDTVA
jgi:hypothetical protein